MRAPPAISTCAVASFSSGLADSVTLTTWASPSPPGATSSAAACAARPATSTPGPSSRTSLLGEARLLPVRLIRRTWVAAPRDHVEVIVVELAVLPLQIGQDDERVNILLSLDEFHAEAGRDADAEPVQDRLPRIDQQRLPEIEIHGGARENLFQRFLMGSRHRHAGYSPQFTSGKSNGRTIEDAQANRRPIEWPIEELRCGAVGARNRRWRCAAIGWSEGSIDGGRAEQPGPSAEQRAAGQEVERGAQVCLGDDWLARGVGDLHVGDLSGDPAVPDVVGHELDRPPGPRPERLAVPGGTPSTRDQLAEKPVHRAQPARQAGARERVLEADPRADAGRDVQVENPDGLGALALGAGERAEQAARERVDVARPADRAEVRGQVSRQTQDARAHDRRLGVTAEYAQVGQRGAAGEVLQERAERLQRRARTRQGPQHLGRELETRLEGPALRLAREVDEDARRAQRCVGGDPWVEIEFEPGGPDALVEQARGHRPRPREARHVRPAGLSTQLLSQGEAHEIGE